MGRRAQFKHAVVATAVLATPAALPAAEMAEYFNGYGSSTVSINGLNGGTGWAGAWTSPGNNSYFAASQVNYAATGYASTGNLSSASDGGIKGSSTTSIAKRATGPLAGTVWISVAVQQSAIGDDVLFWLGNPATTNGTDRDFVAIRGSTGTSGTSSPPEPLIAYNGVGDDSSDNTDIAVGAAHLILLRIDINGSGANDLVRYWVDPDLSGGQAGLGLTVGSTNGPKYFKSTEDTFGTALDGIGLSANSTGNTFDAIRVSNEANGFTWVTTGVPEPTSFGLLGAVGGGLLLRRRRTTHPAARR